MISMSCPNCSSSLEFGDDMAGFETACYSCYHPLKVPAAPVRRPEAPPAAAQPAPSKAGVGIAGDWRSDYSSLPGDVPSYRSRRSAPGFSAGLSHTLKVRLMIVAAALVIGGVGLYLTGGHVFLYVDNGGDQPLVVSLDGKVEATIPPGKYQKIQCEPGQHRLQVRSGDLVVFDETKNLRKPEKFGTNRRYLFNPDNRNRYRVYTVEYGSNPFEGLLRHDADTPMPEGQSAIHAAFHALALEPQLLPIQEWFEIPDGAQVFAQPPSFISTRSFSEKRSFLTRVNRKDYDQLMAARQNQNPTEKDLLDLLDLLERIMDEEQG